MVVMVGYHMMGELWVMVGYGSDMGFVFIFKIVGGRWWFS